MDWAGWAVFGIAATVTLTTIMVAAQLAGLSRMDIPLMLGTMFTDRPDRARFVGFLVHVVNGQIFALGTRRRSRCSTDRVGGSARCSVRGTGSPR
jgi:hypothetical protein